MPNTNYTIHHTNPLTISVTDYLVQNGELPGQLVGSTEVRLIRPLPHTLMPPTKKVKHPLRAKTSKEFHEYFEALYNGKELKEEELESYIQKGLADCPSTVTTHLLYASDIKGMNYPDIVAMAIPIVLKYKPALPFVYALIKGLVHQNKWKLICEFVNDNASGRIRTYILSIIAAHIRYKNHKCLREMPRQGRITNRIRGYMKLTPVAWRRTLSKGCWGSIYNLMSHQKWNTIKYDRLGAYVLAENYRAFMRHDKERFRAFLIEFPAIAKIVRSIRMSKSKKRFLSQKEIYDTYFIVVEETEHGHE